MEATGKITQVLGARCRRRVPRWEFTGHLQCLARDQRIDQR